LLLLLPLVVQSAGPAAAGGGIDGDCGDGDLCLFFDANQQGCVWDSGYGEDFRNEHYISCPDRGLNDSASSYRNNRPVEWLLLFENPHYKGATYCIGPHASGNVPAAFNDKASSSSTAGSEQMTPDVVRKNCKWVDTD
jgi:hypothetical protein